ncbi:MAG: hypothetical protein WAN50_03690 [Minisyncoccia bacterium]
MPARRAALAINWKELLAHGRGSGGFVGFVPQDVYEVVDSATARV